MECFEIMVNAKPVKLGSNVRMSFAKIDEVVKMPNLIEIQKDINSETGRRYYDIEKKSVEFDKKLVALLELLEKTEKAIKEVEDLKKDILKKQNA